MSIDPYKEAESYKNIIPIYDGLVKSIFEAVGFIQGGFCPDPCEHTTLQTTNPDLYARLMNIWSVYTQTKELLEQMDHYYGVIIPKITNPDLDDDPF